MGKKKTQINTTPLTAQTIGVVKKKRFNWIGGIILIAFFAAVIFYMPEIQVLVDQYILNKPIDNNTIINNNTNTKTNENTNKIPEEKIDNTNYLTFNNTSYTLNNLSFYDISFNQETYEFTFSIESSEAVNLASKSTFLQFYDQNKIVTSRKYLFNNLSANTKQNYRTIINEVPTYFAIVEIPIEEYDYFNLDVDENNNSVLKCIKEKQEITYNFLDEKLNTIDDITSFDNFDDDIKTYYDSKAETLNEKAGYNAYFDANEGKYIINVEVNKISGGNAIYYFDKNTMPREIRFKMEAMDYTCK